MKGEANRSLTVIISPLQSLMKDQVDVLRQRHDITAAATINGLLSPLERSEALERVREGGANLLYISPESLRSSSIFNLLKARHINRFVIDEAHCFSAWGQDFRVDYLYIGPFIRKLQEAKNLTEPIPVSCFTATAKPAVTEDIQAYFRKELGLELELFKTGAGRNPFLQAQCFILFDENDLHEHFSLLNSARLSQKEIYQIWQGIKRFKKKTFTKSALEIARQAGWDTEMYELETRVKTAIAALEDAGYVRREENAPRIFAQSIRIKNVEEANRRIDDEARHFAGEFEINAAKRVFGSLISRARSGMDTRVDAMADQLGLELYFRHCGQGRKDPRGGGSQEG